MTIKRKYRILIVEDERLIRLNTMKKLSKHGYECLGAESGSQAIRCISEQKPDLILMDIAIKGEMDGIETANQIKSIADIPIIFLTAYANDQTIEKAAALGCDGYLIKPFKEKQLLGTIIITLRKRQFNFSNFSNSQSQNKLKSSLGENKKIFSNPIDLLTSNYVGIWYLKPVNEEDIEKFRSSNYLSICSDGYGFFYGDFNAIFEIIDSNNDLNHIYFICQGYIPHLEDKIEAKEKGKGYIEFENDNNLKISFKFDTGYTHTVTAQKSSYHQPEESNKSILLVDDDPNLILIVSEYLDFRGFQILVALDGEEAYHYYVTYQPNINIVLTDVMMPFMDGYTLTQKIKKLNPNQLVMMLSAKGQSQDKVKGFNEGADAYMTKPFEPEELVVQLQELLQVANNQIENPRIKQLLALNKELNCSNKKLKEGINISDNEVFCRAAAHSIRNDFSLIGDLVREIKELANNSQDIEDKCHVVLGSVKHSEVVLQRLLDYFKLGNPTVKPINIYTLIKDIEDFQKLRLSSNINLRIEFDSSCDDINSLYATSNYDQIMGIILELINNAKKALSTEGGNIEVNIQKNAKQILIYVKDDALGISEDLKKKIFKEETNSEKGSGLGLLLSKRVMNNLGGDLTLESSKQGACFLVSLPVS